MMRCRLEHHNRQNTNALSSPNQTTTMVQSVLDPTLAYSEPSGAPVDLAVETEDCPRYLLKQSAPGGLDHQVAIGRITYRQRATGRIAVLNIYLLDAQDHYVRNIGVFEYWDWQVPALTAATETVGGVRKPYNLGDHPPLFFESVTAEYMRSAHSAFHLRKPMAPAAPPATKRAAPQQQEAPLAAAPPAKKTKKAAAAAAAAESSSSGKLTRASIFEPTTASAALLAKKPAAAAASGDWAAERAKAERVQEAFRPAESDTWLQKFLRSRAYKNEPNEGAGDCLFLALVQAYANAGAHTSVASLRAVLAQEATQSDFEDKRMLHDMALKERDDTARQVQELRGQYTAAAAKLSAPEGMTKDERRALRAEAERLAAAHTRARAESAAAKENYADTAWMHKVDSLAALRAMVQTREYYADEWAIKILERFLRLKMIILEESAEGGRLRCGEAVAEDAAPPTHYVLLEFIPARIHYELVMTAEGRALFDFAQLPTAIKMLVVDTCISRGGGGGYGPEFRRLLPAAAATGGASPPDDDAVEGGGGKKSTTTFTLSPDKAWDNAAPGKADFEEEGGGSSSSMHQQLRNHKRWRRMLDDSWRKAPFAAGVNEQQQQQLRWASVVHFLAAAPLLAAGNETAFRALSLSAGSAPLATDPKVALRAVTAVKKKSDETEQGMYHEDYARGLKLVDLGALRLAALRAKFGQSADLRTVLLLTGDARLQTVVRGKPAIADAALMKVRSELAR